MVAGLLNHARGQRWRESSSPQNSINSGRTNHGADFLSLPLEELRLPKLVHGRRSDQLVARVPGLGRQTGSPKLALLHRSYWFKSEKLEIAMERWTATATRGSWCLLLPIGGLYRRYAGCCLITPVWSWSSWGASHPNPPGVAPLEGRPAAHTCLFPNGYIPMDPRAKRTLARPASSCRIDVVWPPITVIRTLVSSDALSS